MSNFELTWPGTTFVIELMLYSRKNIKIRTLWNCLYRSLQYYEMKSIFLFKATLGRVLLKIFNDIPAFQVALQHHCWCSSSNVDEYPRTHWSLRPVAAFGGSCWQANLKASFECTKNQELQKTRVAESVGKSWSLAIMCTSQKLQRVLRSCNVQ